MNPSNLFDSSTHPDVDIDQVQSALAEFGPEFAFAMLLLARAPLAQGERERLASFLSNLRDPAQIRTAFEVGSDGASLLISYDF
jgi:hypothetical protein